MSDSIVTSTGRVLSAGDTLDCGHRADRNNAAWHRRDAIAEYAVTPENWLICYTCADDRQRDDMLTDDKIVAYVSQRNSDRWALTTWSGGVLANSLNFSQHATDSGWHGSKIYTWRFRAADGSIWYGRNGGPGMVITARRAKSGTPALPYGSRMACRHCEADIEFVGQQKEHRTGTWRDRGGVGRCYSSGHVRRDPETGAVIPWPVAQLHSPYRPGRAS